jgi:glucokinase
MTTDLQPVLALDLGGTQLRTAIALPDGTLVARRTESTPRAADLMVEAATRALRAALDDATRAGVARPVALGISAPGPLDPAEGVLIDPPNLDRRLWNFPLARSLGDALGVQAVLERDTQVAALAEGEFGAARGIADYVYITVSTGIGGGVVVGNRLMRGPDALAGELGHISVDMDGPPCGCGARGHLEAISSGTGIAWAARERGLGDLSAAQVAALEDAGDESATQIMEYARRAFADALVAIVDIFNPSRVVVGGGIAIGQGDRLLAPAREAVSSFSFKRQAARVEIVPAQLGDDVGLIGALSLVRLARVGEDRDLNFDVTASGHSALMPERSSAHDQTKANKVDDATS